MLDIEEIVNSNYSQISWLKPNIMFLTKHGSHAYGLQTETSDLDLKGFAFAKKDHYFGFLSKFEQAESRSPNDCVIYELTKFMRLAADANPSILEVLFTDESDHLIKTRLGEELLSYRDKFLSKKVRFTYQGYAYNQLKRLKLHKSYILNGVKSPPSRKEMGLPEHTLIPKDQLQAAQSMIQDKLKEWNLYFLEGIDEAGKIALKEKFEKILLEIRTSENDLWINAARHIGYDDNFIWLLQKEKEYQSRKQEYDNYISWKKNRNPKRAELEEKYLYDTKFGMHIARLSLMCKEILETGKVIVKRPDREFLLGIRNGCMTYDQLIEWTDKQNTEIDNLYQTSVLPHSPNKDYLNKICISLIERALAHG